MIQQWLFTFHSLAAYLRASMEVFVATLLWPYISSKIMAIDVAAILFIFKNLPYTALFCLYISWHFTYYLFNKYIMIALSPQAFTTKKSLVSSYHFPYELSSYSNYSKTDKQIVSIIHFVHRFHHRDIDEPKIQFYNHSQKQSVRSKKWLIHPRLCHNIFYAFDYPILLKYLLRTTIEHELCKILDPSIIKVYPYKGESWNSL